MLPCSCTGFPHLQQRRRGHLHQVQLPLPQRNHIQPGTGVRRTIVVPELATRWHGARQKRLSYSLTERHLSVDLPGLEHFIAWPAFRYVFHGLHPQLHLKCSKSPETAWRCIRPLHFFVCPALETFLFC